MMNESAGGISGRRRGGFTLVEVVIAAAIIALLASVTVPSLLGFLDRQRAQTTADKLSAIADGIASFETSVKTGGAGTNTYPGEVSELANPITTSATTDKNSCGNAFNQTAVNNWNSFGPFVTFYIPPGGLVTPIGKINDALVRTPATANVGTIRIQIANVSSEDATTLDQIVDGGDGLGAGIVQWTAFVSGVTATLSYIIPVAAKC